MCAANAWESFGRLRAWHLFLLALGCLVGCGTNSVQSPQPPDRIQALQSADPAVVLRLATSDPSPHVRRAAVARLDDQSALMRIVLEDKDQAVRLAALARVSDQAALRTIAKSVYSLDLALPAIQRLVDTESLKDVAESQTIEEARVAAIARIDDQDFLERMAESRRFMHAAEAAVGRLKDPSAVLARMAQNDWVFTRAIVARKTNDTALLVRLARDKEAYVASIAAARVQDAAVLDDLALNSPHIEVKRKVVPLLASPKVLAAMAAREHDHEVQRAIFGRTEEPAVLMDLAMKTRVVTVGCPIAARLEDLQAVRRLAEHAASDNTRRVARLRLLMAHPFVKRHTEGLQLTCVATTVKQPYWLSNPAAVWTGPPGRPSFVQEGESAELHLLSKGATLTQESWQAKFPEKLGGPLQMPVSISVDISRPVAALLDSAALDQGELAQFGASDLGPEIRLAAVNRMTDVDALRRLVSRQSELHVIEAIHRRIQAVATR